MVSLVDLRIHLISEDQDIMQAVPTPKVPTVGPAATIPIAEKARTTRVVNCIFAGGILRDDVFLVMIF